MNMKQVLSLILALCLVFALAACGETEEAPTTEPEKSAEGTEGTDPTGDPTEPSSPDKSEDPSDPDEGAQPPADSEQDANQTLTKLTLSTNQKELVVGATFQLVAVFEPATANPTLHFESDDPSVATVDEDGLITAVSAGSCTITVTCDGLSAECTLTCVDNAVEDPELNPEL